MSFSHKRKCLPLSLEWKRTNQHGLLPLYYVEAHFYKGANAQ